MKTNGVWAMDMFVCGHAKEAQILDKFYYAGRTKSIDTFMSIPAMLLEALSSTCSSEAL